MSKSPKFDTKFFHEYMSTIPRNNNDRDTCKFIEQNDPFQRSQSQKTK